MDLADCWQINLQQGFGGGEVYTGFLTEALQALGIRSHVFVSRTTSHWQALLPTGTEIIPVGSAEAILSLLPANPAWVLSHGALASTPAQRLAASHFLTAIAHMPLYGRKIDGFSHHQQVYAVSAYVRDSLRKFLRPDQVYDSPLYGIARQIVCKAATEPSALRRRSRFDWDTRKGRDRLLSWIEPWVEPLLPHPVWARKPGITLGIVSRLTPIKQFPLLFSLLVPHLLKFPQFNLEIVGAGGFASVRDLTAALKPLGPRVRFWGHQFDVQQVYHKIDYLLTGLPEKEALGLNVIEAQACGTPVLAVDAPPFTETVLDGKTGFLYRDPRQDDGMAFSALMERVTTLTQPLVPAEAHEHLAQFSFDAFVSRLSPVVAAARRQLKMRAV